MHIAAYLKQDQDRGNCLNTFLYRHNCKRQGNHLYSFQYHRSTGNANAAASYRFRAGSPKCAIILSSCNVLAGLNGIDIIQRNMAIQTIKSNAI